MSTAYNNCCWANIRYRGLPASSALELDERQSEMWEFCVQLAGMLKALELRTWTGNASQQQSALARLASGMCHVGVVIAFWSLAKMNTICRRLCVDGEFWFLPTADAKTGEVRMPVAKVLDCCCLCLRRHPLRRLGVQSAGNLWRTRRGIQMSLRSKPAQLVERWLTKKCRAD